MSLLRENSSPADHTESRGVPSSVTLRHRLLAQRVADRLLGDRPLSALPKILALASSEDVEISEAPVNSAQEVLSTWYARLVNATLNEKRVVGLKSLVQALRSLPADETIEQINVFAKRRTGIVFFSLKSGELIGAIFSTRTDADDRRSQRNFLAANAESTAPDQQVVNLRFMHTK
ncbi:hypothetical protein SAMN05421819_2912 [Bryocella elongata]|uniref:Uncharacterized protein n=1 Tax=Bryocella elongata TaxID=863522 RepID=A0A1H6A3V1_9BACT|nr:hypothetical protein [Bryocella elongata]SEG43409.1 hypothetical protein SAMN05421819_2912 [Bryocella elongata]